ncbi:MAG: tol-pal system-associated acyl-CoA thioesterase [Parvularcula sp.]|jgi:acyl-CoA thioester hydrolase|nr:tol-pal system-associated acyl-CoA thioesterase [Parvularcula sp.]
MAHEIDFRIYFEDTDVTGIVYHANYIKYFERGRTEALRAAFSDLSALMAAEDPCTFAVSKLEIAYKRPARLDDIITVSTQITYAKAAKMVFDQKIFRGDELLAEGTVTVAVITLDGRPRRMPEGLAKRMAELVP